jgi:uncharacterized coiled-coil DUF342 family protein
MGTVPIVEGTVEGGEIDPSKLTHDDITELANEYQKAVGVIDKQRKLINEANRVIMKLQTMLRELRGEINVEPNSR